MTNHGQLQPIVFDEVTNEPYLRLPHPHTHIIITPFRPRDAHEILPILNDERVYKWLTGPSHPYLLEHAEAWITKEKGKSDKIIQMLGQHADSEELKLVDGCPLHILREVKEDGSQVFLGDISFVRCRWEELDVERRKILVVENESRVPGDPELIWSVGGAPRCSSQQLIRRI
jgi:RimJ/RimL family protein N-acetyltransferase